MSCANDLHALAIQRVLRERLDARCDVIEVDTFAGHSEGLTWSTSGRHSRLPARDGDSVSIPDIDVIWYRRANMPQIQASDLQPPGMQDVVNNSCTSALHGLLASHFAGRWVSDPEATRLAENKLVQLRAAVEAGLRVPRTLVSQNPVAIKKFCDELEGAVVMKPLRPARDRQLVTVMVTPEVHANPEALRLCPTIFQEYVPGTRHLRVLCCGMSVRAFAIDSPDLDWRPNLQVPVTSVALSEETAAQLRSVLVALGLRMGVFDLKVPDGEPVWLEVNPQGQFLFLEGLTGVDLSTYFAHFLLDEAAVPYAS